MEFKEIYDTMLKPSRDRMSKAWAAGKSRLSATIRVPDVPVQSEQLRSPARQLGRLIWRFNFAVNRALIMYREPILEYCWDTGESPEWVVRHVLIHEIGHHFGLSDEDMDRIERADDDKTEDEQE